MRPVIKHILLLLLIFDASLMCHAQLFSDYNFKFRTYTTADGLAHNSVKKCISDSKGFLWIITENGLSRFDGYQFKNYQQINNDSSSLPVNDLWDIAIDKSDRIFLAYKTGLSILEPSTGKFTKIKKEGKDVEAERIIYNKNNHLLYIATHNGLLKYDATERKLSTTSLMKEMQSKVENMFLDNTGNIWLLIQRNGYYRYSITKDSAFYYNSEDWPMCIYQDNSNAYYMGTWGSGFQVFNKLKEEQKKETYSLKLSGIGGNNYIFCGITESPALTGADILWVSAMTSGIGLFSKSQKKFVKHITYQPQIKNGLTTSFNWNIYTAIDGTVWICSWNGLIKVNRQGQYFQGEELPELNSNDYNCVTGLIDDPADKNIAWMAVNGSGLIKYSKPENKIISRYYSAGNQEDARKNYLQRWPVNIFKDSNNVLWSGSYAGFIKIKNGQVSFKNLQNNNDYSYAQTNYQDSKGNLWQAGRQLFQYNPYTDKLFAWNSQKTGGKNYYFFGVCEAPDGTFYAGTNNGLLKLNSQTQTSEQINWSDQIADSDKWKVINSVIAIDSILYIGTLNGLAAYNLNTQITSVIGAEKNLERISWAAFCKDEQKNLWIYCSNGVFRYKPQTKEITQFTTADGIYTTSNDPAYFFTYNGNIFVGSRMAFTKFNPASINTNKNLPVPYITAAYNKNITYEAGKTLPGQLRLDYTNNDINFDFTAIEYNFPEKLSFSFILEGFDKEWSPLATVRTKSYTNLPAGKYIFKVKAFNNAGTEGKNAASFYFIIHPPFWQTWWFKVLAVLIIGLIIYFIVQKRINAIRKKEKEKTAINKMMAELETKMLRSQMNPHFIFNSLNSVQKYIWENKEEDAAEYLSSFAMLMRNILENSRHEYISLKKEVEFLKLYTQLEYRRSNNNFNYSITVDEKLDTDNTFVPPMLLQPFIENAIWHGLNKKQQKGNLLIHIYKKEEQLVCIVDDDGVGRQQTTKNETEKKSLGISITQQRIDRLMENTSKSASVSIKDKIENSLPAGTEVTVILPLQTDSNYA